MNLRKMVGAAALLLLAVVGRADTFSFQLMGPSDAAQGSLIVASAGQSGSYVVTGISGTMNGLSITSLIPPDVYPPDAPNDNAFFYPATPGTTYFDNCGLSFELSDGTDVNLFYGFYSSSGGLLGQGYLLIEGVDETASAVTSLSFMPAGTPASVTPEPSTLALLSSGLGLLSLLRRRKAGAAATWRFVPKTGMSGDL